jgi:hypothetical protein
MEQGDFAAYAASEGLHEATDAHLYGRCSCPKDTPAQFYRALRVDPFFCEPSEAREITIALAKKGLLAND